MKEIPNCSWFFSSWCVMGNDLGMCGKVLNKIYQPFFTTKPAGKGTGLGLSLSYDIVTKGIVGELKVQRKEGEGSEFIVQRSISE
jgi:C4-dicarboxylate-specific signal transduction histidine kinase